MRVSSRTQSRAFSFPSRGCGTGADAERDLLFSKFAENANPKGRGFGVWGNDRFSSGHGFSRAATAAKRERLSRWGHEFQEAILFDHGQLSVN
jgi:hypothetical protein